MADLRDPDKPAGWVEIVNGLPIRNDDVVLKPARKNPWYVLMTIAGEIEGDRFFPENQDRIAKNRRYWNAWACSEMSEGDRSKLAEKLSIDPSELESWTDVERAEVERVFRARLGAFDLPLPDDRIGMSGVHFSNSVVLKKAVFTGRADFQSTTFTGDADFESTTFTGDADFESATFSGSASFRSTTFTRNASFQGATFAGDAEFRSTTFDRYAYFSRATFSATAFFKGAEFTNFAYLTSAKFIGPASFQGVVFAQNASFRNTNFTEYSDFQGATFGGPADFQDGPFNSTTTFRQARFKATVPTFYQRSFHQNTDFSAARGHWPFIETMDQGQAGEAKRAYSRLAQVMAELHKPDDEQFFRRQEMRCAAMLADGPHRWMYRVYGAVSDYGYSVWRPLAWLGGVVVAGAAAFTVPSAFQARTWTDLLWPFLENLGPSFSGTFAFLGFLRRFHDGFFNAPNPEWFETVSGAQTIFGVVLLFFLGLGLRNRFRLK